MAMHSGGVSPGVAKTTRLRRGELAEDGVQAPGDVENGVPPQLPGGDVGLLFAVRAQRVAAVVLVGRETALSNPRVDPLLTSLTTPH